MNQNGEVIERIRQNVHSKQEPGVTAPNTHVVTEIELPAKGVHKVYEDDIPRVMYKKKYDDNRLYNMLTNNLVHIFQYVHVKALSSLATCKYTVGRR